MITHLKLESPKAWLLVVLLSLGPLLAGCMPGTIETVAGTAFIWEQKQDYKHKNEVDRAVDKYVRDHAESPCKYDEDRVMTSAVEILKKYRLTGLEEVYKRLEGIYEDESQPDNVRAGALYNMAVLQSRRHAPKKILARELFKQLYIEFPNEYRCIFKATEWRDSMIEQQLLLPGETVESFLREAAEDIEKRKGVQ
ncbi:hypothetical protein [Marinobacter sp. SS8-8]|uniref:hypothetical protein n=1 Tax=Marinobacter sp. SS8-8 TaxID=3050452 RepID=UPI000C42E59D|nr:hypothetical protein [Marinobacter sp. SS8-8]MAZ06231.1 hypothetical protein [Halomonas sp.]|tara:strand:- start:478 stop:1065 length:588 start_codon:yes stop_codon:yes gene_type:complete